MASTLSSAPSFLSFSPQTTLTCPVPAPTFSLPLLLLLVPLSLAPLSAQRQWLQGLTIFIATFLCHMIPQRRVWSQQKVLTLLGLNISCREEGNSWRRGKGGGGGGGEEKAIRQAELEGQTQKADRRKQKLLSRKSFLSHLSILSKPYLQWNKIQWSSLFLSPDTSCPKTEWQS